MLGQAAPCDKPPRPWPGAAASTGRLWVKSGDPIGLPEAAAPA